MHTSTILQAAQAIQTALIENEATLESLDRAIGDGDHYINMKRGVAALVAMQAELSLLAPDVALQRIGMKLLSTIGGASGPLFASFFISMGKTLQDNGSDTPAQIAAAFAAGVQAIMQRGKAQPGEKTMLDVLVPVSHAFTTLTATNADFAHLLEGLRQTAEQGVLATRDMLASKGRAAGLGERALGHIDPGAQSCALMIGCICDLLQPNQHE